MQTYGLIGYPLSHSFSRRFFTAWFADHAIDARYLNFEISDIAMLPAVLAENPQLAGFNVTIPYKQAIIPYLDSCDTGAASIGAVNTVKIERSNGELTLTGFNTDLIGFRDSITPLMKSHHRKALVLGTGGASKAVVAVLEGLGIEVALVSRNKSGLQTLGYGEISSAIMEEYTIVVNTTPLGTFPDTEKFPPVPYGMAGSRHLFYDLVYNPPVTQFLARGEMQGATIKNGLEMLERQALAAWDIWNR